MAVGMSVLTHVQGERGGAERRIGEKVRVRSAIPPKGKFRAAVGATTVRKQGHDVVNLGRQANHGDERDGGAGAKKKAQLLAIEPAARAKARELMSGENIDAKAAGR